MVLSVHEFIFKMGRMVTVPMAVEGIALVGGGLSRSYALPRNRPFSLLQIVFSWLSWFIMVWNRWEREVQLVESLTSVACPWLLDYKSLLTEIMMAWVTMPWGACVAYQRHSNLMAPSGYQQPVGQVAYQRHKPNRFQDTSDQHFREYGQPMWRRMDTHVVVVKGWNRYPAN